MSKVHFSPVGDHCRTLHASQIEHFDILQTDILADVTCRDCLLCLGKWLGKHQGQNFLLGSRGANSNPRGTDTATATAENHSTDQIRIAGADIPERVVAKTVQT